MWVSVCVSHSSYCQVNNLKTIYLCLPWMDGWMQGEMSDHRDNENASIANVTIFKNNRGSEIPLHIIYQLNIY